MILGIITFVAFLLTAARLLTKYLPSSKLNAFIVKAHPIFGIITLIISVLHAITSWSLFYQRPTGMFIIGIIMIVFLIIAVLSHAFMKKLGIKWLTIHKAASIITCVFLFIHILLGATSFYNYQNAIASINYNDIQFNQVADGKYEGEFDAGYIYVKVSVTVEEGKVTSIDILQHRNERGVSAEQITKTIILKQSLDVDAVSGATNSSKVIKKAIENALEQ